MAKQSEKSPKARAAATAAGPEMRPEPTISQARHGRPDAAQLAGGQPWSPTDRRRAGSDITERQPVTLTPRIFPPGIVTAKGRPCSPLRKRCARFVKSRLCPVTFYPGQPGRGGGGSPGPRILERKATRRDTVRHGILYSPERLASRLRVR